MDLGTTTVRDNVFKEHKQRDSKQNRTPPGDTNVRTESAREGTINPKFRTVPNSERGGRGWGTEESAGTSK